MASTQKNFIGQPLVFVLTSVAVPAPGSLTWSSQGVPLNTQWGLNSYKYTVGHEVLANYIVQPKPSILRLSGLL